MHFKTVKTVLSIIILINLLLTSNDFKAQSINIQKDTTLPKKFPEISVKLMNNPSSGNIFIAPFSSWGMFPDIDNYIAIIDNYGHPIYFKRIYHNSINDFKLQANGQITYGGGKGVKHYIMNKKMQLIDSINPLGYWVDYHEVTFTKDGHKFLLGIDTRLVDMSEIVPGGQTNCTVMGHVIQEFDEDNIVIFEWNTWDHYEILDCEPYVDLTKALIDLAHVNTVEIDTDSTLIILSRNMNEITKISRLTGEIIWRMGGINNEFTFTNDTVQWAWPHDIRKIGEGLFSMFDNGRFNTPEPHHSSGVIYQIDETAKTITQVSRFRNEPDIYGSIMGNFQLLDNGNFFTGWGSGSYPDSTAITEFNADGSIEHIINFNAINYRAHKHLWQPRLFYAESDTMDFGKLGLYSENEVSLKLFNNSDSSIAITGYHFRFNHFSIDTNFPISIPANDSIDLQVLFNPNQEGIFENVLTLHSDNADTTERIGHQVYLKAEAVDDTGIDDFNKDVLIVSPNPTQQIAKIFLPKISSGYVHIIDMTGKTISIMEFTNSKTIEIDMGTATNGIYIVKIDTSTNKTYQAKIFKY